jgi:TonB family protein
MRVAILLFCCALAFGQDTSTAPETKPQTPASCADQKQQPTETSPNNSLSKYAAGMSAGSVIQQAAQAAEAHRGGTGGGQEGNFGLGTGAHGRQTGPVEILSDTQGVDFDPYLQNILQHVRENWYHLIPASASMRRGKLAIEFAITKDGRVADMRLVASSGDVALDRPAWGSITASNPFPPLPDEFTGPYLALRFRFFYNPDKSELAQADSAAPAQANPAPAQNPNGAAAQNTNNYPQRPDLGGPNPNTPQQPSLYGSANKTSPEAAHANETAPSQAVMVCISGPADLQVLAGGAKIMNATVMGTGDHSLEWIVSGSGCAGPACGKISDDLYIAPIVRPNQPVVTLTAVSKADPTKKASVTVHIVRPDPQIPSKP